MKFKRIFAVLFSIVLVVLLGIFDYSLYTKANFFTKIQKYLIVVAGIVLVYFIIKAYTKVNWIEPKKRDKKSKKFKIKFFSIASHFLIIILCGCLAFGNFTLINLNQFIADVTEDDEFEESTSNRYYAFTMEHSQVTSLGSDYRNIGIMYEERGAMYLPFKNYMEETYDKVEGVNYELTHYLDVGDFLASFYLYYLDTIFISEDLYYRIIQLDPSFMEHTIQIGTVDLINAVASKPVDVTKESFNVLILGCDIRPGDGTIKTDTRCDSIMVASFNPKTMQISLVSLPRDSYVEVNGIYDKLGHSGNSGIATVVQTVENILGIEINYYTKFNFRALVSIIDALGGIDVDVLYPFTEVDSNDVPDAITLETGYQHLNGEEALAYARHRKTVTDSARANAQQLIIQAITDKVVSFSSITNMQKLFKSVSKNMMTNFTQKEIYSLMSLAPNLINASFASMVLDVENGEFIYFPQYDMDLMANRLIEDSLNQARDQISAVLAGVPVPTAEPEQTPPTQEPVGELSETPVEQPTEAPADENPEPTTQA